MNRSRMTALLLVLGVGGCVSSEERHFIAAVKNKPAMDFSLTSLAGDNVRLSQFRGKPTVLAFWAST